MISREGFGVGTKYAPHPTASPTFLKGNILYIQRDTFKNNKDLSQTKFKHDLLKFAEKKM